MASWIGTIYSDLLSVLCWCVCIVLFLFLVKIHLIPWTEGDSPVFNKRSLLHYNFAYLHLRSLNQQTCEYFIEWNCAIRTLLHLYGSFLINRLHSSLCVYHWMIERPSESFLCILLGAVQWEIKPWVHVSSHCAAEPTTAATATIRQQSGRKSIVPSSPLAKLQQIILENVRTDVTITILRAFKSRWNNKAFNLCALNNLLGNRIWTDVENNTSELNIQKPEATVQFLGVTRYNVHHEL